MATLASMFSTLPELPDSLALWFYRAGDYLMRNALDDPAWLALMFC